MRARLFACVIYYEITLFVNFVFESEWARENGVALSRGDEGRRGTTGTAQGAASLIDLPEFVIPRANTSTMTANILLSLPSTLLLFSFPFSPPLKLNPPPFSPYSPQHLSPFPGTFRGGYR